MTAKPNYFRLGLFVIVMLTLLVGALLYLGIHARTENECVFETCFKESVSGLDVGAPVKYRGVRVGKVSSIDFAVDIYASSPDVEEFIEYGKFVIVRLGIDPDQLEYFSNDTKEIIPSMVERGLRIKMTSAGLTGITFLELDYVEPERNPPIDIFWEPKYPYVPSAPSQFSRMLTSVEDVLLELEMVDFVQIAEDLDSLLVTGREAIAGAQIAKRSEEAGALLTDLRETNERLSTLLNKPEVEQFIVDAAEIMAGVRGVVEGSREDFTALLARLREASQKASDLLSDERIDTMLTGLANAAESAPDSVDSLRNATDRIDRLLASESGEIQLILQDLKKLMANLAKLSEDALEYPSKMLFSTPPSPVDLGGNP